ncbi:excalibur calcium-binding domain-containing protein, partial [Streptomyces sp. SID3343]|uniref:excalibur calcium-binding domain-containing protein n=1 Tax=Streptomyces sp. SID3343 TaxID=2690260 RepID=UPI0013701BE3
AADPPRTVTPPKTVNPPEDRGGDAPVYYKNCTAVRAAGAAPIHRGEPGYAAHLDRDGDGTACE